MTWGKFVRLNGIEQSLKRRIGQDPLSSLNDKDVTVLLYDPFIIRDCDCLLCELTKWSFEDGRLVMQVPSHQQGEEHIYPEQSSKTDC